MVSFTLVLREAHRRSSVRTGRPLLFHQGVQVVQIAHVGAGSFLSTMGSDLGHVI